MWSSKLFLLALVSSTVSSTFQPRRRLTTREYASVDTLADSYDFVIVGGGTAGLSLASLLSANSNFTILVIEAGDVGPVSVDTPASTYFESLSGTQYDYDFHTVAQPSAGGRNVSWPRGKLLGGSSAINGMYLIRPHEIEVDAWHDMISSQSDAGQWTWDSFFAAMKKSEAFTPPTEAAVETAGIQYNADSHGTSGAVHHSYPACMVPITQHWLPTVEAAGISLNSDAYGGKTLGGFFSCSAINPSNWTRSYAKSAYFDPLPPRSNLHVLVSNTVTRIVFDTSSDNGLKATAVEFASTSGQKPRSVKVEKEVIVSGGAVNSPQILQLSGVGPSDVLNAARVEVNLDLPGVGTHLQDHISAGVYFESKVDTQGDIYKSGSSLSKTSKFLSFVNSGVAYVNASTLFGGVDGASAMYQAINANLSSFTSSVGTGNNEVLEVFKAIYNTTANKIFNSENALVELLFSINVPGQIAVQAAIQHAFSQGRITISSDSAFDQPNIDPQYFSHWADVITMREGLKLARKIANTPPLNSILGGEVSPGLSVATDDDWDDWLRNNGGTEYHPTSSCAMLPREQGGVVDNKLKVYGTQNVRVVDASVFPINFAAHTMTPTYGLVQKAAEIIQNDYSPTPSNTTQAGGPTNTTATSNNQDNGSGRTTPEAGFQMMRITGSLSILIFIILHGY